MCGIAGKISLNNKSVSRSELELMSKKLEHRGPDDVGYFISDKKNVGLTNRRLSIIDLSQKGHQPLNYMGRYWIVTNGEIYNFREEKKKLQKKGYKFRSDCDTEVIPALYDQYGISCLQHLRGMFAFCIYDSLKEVLFLARDRIGKKPLKYYYDNKTLIFASESKAILTQPEVRKVPDYEALRLYMIYGYIPSPLSGFSGIRKLEPGHYLLMDLKIKTIKNVRYWEPVFRDKYDLSESEWCTEILGCLEDATQLRMISDVPLGAFLSGGVDSSAVVASMAGLSTKPVNTFTVIFDEPEWNEAKYARLIAKEYKTHHMELRVKPQNVEILPEISYFYEEPYADAGAVLSYIVAGLARKYVTVVLNGDGGDENFAGYPNRYFRLKRDVDYRHWINTIRPVAAEGLKALRILTKNRSAARIYNFLEKSKLPLYRRFASYNEIYSTEYQNITKGNLKNALSDNPYKIVEKVFDLYRGSDLKDAGLKFDLMYWLPDDLLTKADITSMTNSLEARSPLLDHKMIELACKIPFDLKVKNGESKYIFKKALEQIVPKENLYRPKRGFGMPLHIWFKKGLNKYATGVLLSKKAKIREIIDTDFIKEMLLNKNEEIDYGPKLWSLLSLELWFESYF